MKTLILVRFAMEPNHHVSEVLKNHIEGKAELIQIPGAVITLFHSESRVSIIDSDLQRCDQGLVYFLFDISNNLSLAQFPRPMKQNIMAFINKHYVAKPKDRLEQLRKELDQMIAVQNFEKAAELRDKIQTIKQKIDETDS